MLRIVFIIAGSLSLLVGIIGIFLPLLPTTPFLLMASACYMRGSRRMADWILANRWFGPILRDFHAGHGIPLKTKLWAIGMLWISLAFSAWLMPAAWARPLLLLPGIAVSVYLWRYKTRRPEAASRP